MIRTTVVVFLCMVVSYAINRPVYKVVLKQKGFAQFLQYDVITPPLSEFTFCAWIRVYDLAEDQSIFTYVINGNNRVIRLWLDSGGRYMKVSIDDKITSSMEVEVAKDVWRHVCLSYQSDYGAWALYVDSRLVSCEAASIIKGFVMPGGGSVIIGYGTSVNGESNGFEGEIFGANMILASTIERNFSVRIDPQNEQKRFPRNKLKDDSKYTDYVVLSDLLNEKIHNSFEHNAPHESFTRSYNDFKVMNEEHSGVTDSISTDKPQLVSTTVPQEDFDFTISDFSNANQEKTDFWNTKTNPRFTFADMYRSQTPPASTKFLSSTTGKAPLYSDTTISEYETPPPVTLDFDFYKIHDLNGRTSQSIYNLTNTTSSIRNINNKIHTTALVDVETPPSIEKEDSNVYGQWTSSKFAGTVLNYLRSINFKNREQIIKRVPQTIPFYKLSDSYPYPSELKINVLRSTSNFRNRKVVQKRYDVVRRDPQINLQILEDDLRNNIIKTHAETQPKKVEIKSRGSSKKRREQRFNRDTQYVRTTNVDTDSLEEHQTKQFVKEKRNNRYFPQPTPGSTRSSKLPFLKSLEYIMESPENTEIRTYNNNHDTHGKNLSQGNKWHNAKSYSNDYTPRKINADESDILDYEKRQYPTLRLRYAPSKSKNKYLKHDDVDPSIIYGRQLATEISNHTFVPHGSISILKYNHEHLPENHELSKFKLKNEVDDRSRMQIKRNMKATNFDHHIKIGNALNERSVIGIDEKHKKQSFLGGDENIPDINKYRSELDNESTKVPPSLGPRACKNVELYDRVLYVQPDESIDLSHILSPVREKNIAIEFVMQNYKKCSLTDSSFQKYAMLLIDWNKTPVRLFGGAYPKTTTDLCGFF